MDGRLGMLEFGDFPCFGQILNTSSHLEMVSLDCGHQRLPNSLGFGLFVFFFFR